MTENRRQLMWQVSDTFGRDPIAMGANALHAIQRNARALDEFDTLDGQAAVEYAMAHTPGNTQADLARVTGWSAKTVGELKRKKRLTRPQRAMLKWAITARHLGE